jgi:branched-chain amino acid transport system substrate-binding protein
MKYKLLFIIFLVNIAVVFSQDIESNIKKEFQIGVNLYSNYQYDEALDIFKRISEDNEANSRTTASLLFEGKIYLKKSNENEADSVFDRLFRNYPSSKYSDEARMMHAGYYLENSEYSKSMRELCLLIMNSSSEQYISQAKQTSEKIALLHLNVNELDSLFNTFTLPKVHSCMLLLKAKVSLLKNNHPLAKEYLTDLIQNFPASEEKKEAASILAELNKPDEKEGNLFGVILPLYSASKDSNGTEPGPEILEGIKYAVSEYNNTHEEKVGLIIRDSGQKPERIKEIKNEFVKIPNLKIIIGPIYSDEVKTTLEIFKDTDIPVISPTATENNLTTIYPNFFQANPSFILRGKIIAQYLFYVEDKKKMAMLSPEAGYSVAVASAFKDEFKRLGGKLIVDVSYSSKTFDLTSQVSKIQQKIKDIEGLYIPLTDKGDAPVVLSQLEQNNIDLKLYGNQDWLSAKGFESSSNLSNQLTFTSDYFIDYEDADYQDLNRKFHLKAGMDANRDVLYGYDAAEYVLKSLPEGRPGRSEIKKALESGIVYKGIHNNIIFDSERINRFLNVIRYKDGKFQLIDKFKTGE